MNLLAVINSYPELAGLVEGQNYPAIAKYLSEAPLIENPETQQTVPVKVDLKELFYLLQPTEFPIVAQVTEILKVGKELSAVMGMPFTTRSPTEISRMLGEQGISAETKTAIDALLAEQEPDPEYQPMVPGEPRWMASGLSKPPGAEDVQAVLNGVS